MIRYFIYAVFCGLLFSCENEVRKPAKGLSDSVIATRVDSLYNAGEAILQIDYNRARPLVQGSFELGYANGQDSLVGMRKVKVATYVVYIGEVGEGLKMIREVIERARKDGPRELLVNACSEMIQMQAYYGSPDSVASYMEQTLGLIDTVNAPTEYANYLRRKGELERLSLDMTGAVQSYTKALEIYDQHGTLNNVDSSATAGALMDLGICLGITGSYTRAYPYFQRAFSYFEKGQAGYAYLAARTIPTAAALGKNEEVERLIEEVLRQPDASADEVYLAYSGRARLAFNKGDYTGALKIVSQLDSLTTRDQSAYLEKLEIEVESTMMLNQLPQARAAVVMLQKYAAVDAQRERADLLTLQLDILQQEGPELAAGLKRLTALQDSISRRDQFLELAETEARYRTAVKDREIAEAKAELDQAAIEKRQLQIRGWGIGLLAIGALCGLILYRKNSRRLDTLNEQLTESASAREAAISALEEKNTALDTANQALESSVRQNKMLNAELNHRVKNNLAMMTSVFQMQSRRTSSNEVKELLRRMEARVQTLNQAYSMLQHQTDEEETLSTNLFFKNLSKNLKAFYTEKDLELRVELAVDEFPVPSSDLVHLGLIVNELISNTVKHTEPINGVRTATLAFTANSDAGYELSYHDQGGQIPDWQNTLRDGRQSLGTKLIDVLAKNLQSEVVVEGGRVKIRTL